jgi:hypothetical protein
MQTRLTVPAVPSRNLPRYFSVDKYIFTPFLTNLHADQTLTVVNLEKSTPVSQTWLGRYKYPPIRSQNLVNRFQIRLNRSGCHLLILAARDNPSSHRSLLPSPLFPSSPLRSFRTSPFPSFLPFLPFLSPTLPLSGGPGVLPPKKLLKFNIAVGIGVGAYLR